MSKSDVEMEDAEKLHNGSGDNVPESECKVIDTKVEREEQEVPCAAAATEDVNQGENGGEDVNKVTEEVPCAAAESEDVKNQGENGGEDVNKVAEEVPYAAADSEDVKNQGENGGEDVNKVTEEVPCAVAASEDVNQGENGGEDVNKVIEEVPRAAAASEDVNQGENGREDVNKVIDEVKDKVNVKTETEVEDQTKLVNEASGEEDMNKSMDEVTDKIDVKTEVEDQTNPVNETSEPAKELDSGITINESHDEALINTETPAEAQTAAISAVEKQCDVKNEVVEHDDTDSAMKEDEPTKNDPVDEIHGKDVEKRPNEDAVEKPKEMGKDTHDTEQVASEMMVEMENADSGNVSLEIKQLPTEISANNEPQRQEAELGDVRPGEDEEMEDAVQFDKEQVDKEHSVKSLTTSHETDGNEKTFESAAKPDAEEPSLANQHEPFTPNALVRCSSEKNADHSGETAKTVFSLAAQPFMGDDDDGTPEDQAAFMKALEHFCRERAMDFKPPKFYGHPLNCLKLWRAVIRLGGYDRVTGSKLWRQVGESFHPPKTCTTVSWTFRIFYEKSLLEFERHKTQSGELQLPIIMLPEVSGADVEGNGFQGSGSGPGRARRDSATRAMQGWHAQRLGAGEVGDPVTKEKNLNNMAKNEKNLKSISSLKQKRPNEIEQSNKAARTDVSKPLVPSVVDVGPPADWVKISVRQAKDCFEVYALVPGLLREEVRVQSDPAGRVVITGQPEQIDNPWGITPFKKIINLPARIHPAHTSAVVSLHGRLYVRLPFEQPI